MSSNSKSPRPSNNRPLRRSSGGGGGGFWLVVALAVAGVGAVFIFAPDLPRSLFGTSKQPTAKGAEPTAPENLAGDAQSKGHSTESDLAKTQVNTLAPSAPKTPVVAAPIPEKAKTYADEVKAKGYLADAEKAYKQMQWQQAANAAHKLDELDASPVTKVRAKDIAVGAPALEKLFKELDEKDELIRYFDTSPGLLVLKSGTSTSLAVPIASLEEQAVIETNPIAFINSQRKTGKVTLLLKGKKDYIATSLPADAVGEVEAADLATIMKDKQSEFDTCLNRLKNSTLSHNALAWYDAGKFAYRNRLDGYVTEMLNQAVLLDPNLVKSVREDKAASLFANVVCHLKNGNQKQADAFMAIITRRYADTDQGKQARLFYEGKNQELLTAAKEAEQRRLDDEKRRRESQLARAKELGDEKAVKQIQESKNDEPEEPASAASATSGDEAQADDLYGKGRDLYNKALDAGNTPERDALYEKAYQQLHQALGIYSRLVDKNPGNDALGVKLLQCSKLHYGTIKQRRFH